MALRTAPSAILCRHALAVLCLPRPFQCASGAAFCELVHRALPQAWAALSQSRWHKRPPPECPAHMRDLSPFLHRTLLLLAIDWDIASFRFCLERPFARKVDTVRVRTCETLKKQTLPTKWGLTANCTRSPLSTVLLPSEIRSNTQLRRPTCFSASA